MDIRIETSLEGIQPAEWDALGGHADPFLSHAFLGALERHDCVGETFGWYPRHLVVRDDAGRLVGAMPMYLKTNSYGELVFDWSWASAYERSGRRY
ncbi:MAG: GNAT family N-acetyltransferase, partial [Gammaproteobacteria bacterium]|nr:GNAT family N-acetyltransferase [Gammaproteobacteria bacterium]MDX5375624.1 GNAT family N-acetyltransferase [Gammaproteobacteria bacterium]